MEREHKPESSRRIFPTGSVQKKATTKKDDHNHPNSLHLIQRVNYRNENINEWKHGRSLYDSCAQDFDGACNCI